MSTSALDLIKGALRRINSYQSGDTIAPPDAQDCLDTFNDLLESLSLDKQIMPGSNEWILSWTTGQRLYTVGNPTNAQLSGANNTGGSFPLTWPNIVGTLTSGLPYIQTVTSIPTNLVAGATAAYQVGSGSILTDVQNVIPAGATVLSFAAGGAFTGTITAGALSASGVTGTLGLGQIITGVGVTAGTYISAVLTPTTFTVTPSQTVGPVAMTTSGAIVMSANATGTSQGTDSIGYSVPGNLPIPRPLRITHGFTRFSNLDFSLDVAETQSQYTSILYKAQPGPWPTVAWYNNQFPYGLLNAYQQPGNNAELHLFADTILASLTLNQPIMLPQGYSRCFKWLLAKEICAEFGFPLSEAIKVNAQESLSFIKALNARPAAVGRYDRELTRGNRADGGWILRGGY